MDGSAWSRRAAGELASLGRSGGVVAGVGIAVVLGVGAWRAQLDAWAVPAFVVLAAVSVLLAVIDARTLRLPDAILLPAAGLGAILLAAASGGDRSALLRAGLGSAITLVAHLALVLARPTGLGLGDVKLAGLLGAHLAWIGWPVIVVGALVPFLLGALWSAVLLGVGRATRATAVPFGPFLVAGAVVAVAVVPP